VIRRDWADPESDDGRHVPLWELFHENSKASPHDRSVDVAAPQIADIEQSPELTSSPSIELPAALACDAALTRAIVAALQQRSPGGGRIQLEALATLLRIADGSFVADGMPARRGPALVTLHAARPFELFVHASKVDGLPCGLYHYHPHRCDLRLLRRMDHTHEIAERVRDANVVYGASAIVFVAATPERLFLVNGDRGYRYALVEAGAVVQTFKLVAGALGLACMATADYFDRQLDAILGLDGLSVSTVTLVAVSAAVPDDAPRGHSGQGPIAKGG
jgi:SagB-type dehydrogenase family enzyme